MKLNKIPNEFSVQIYGDIIPFNEVASKARVRIFYRGKNRNGTYITDHFADKLISTLPYVPVKGIYDEYDEDYSDHGKRNSEGRIYGVVPENPNFAWEKHTDVDGIEREYACADVILFTALYEEASDIVGKAQSMELYADSIEGSWQVIEGQKYYVFSEGCFLGLQVLGNEVEPCFEGSSFYQLIDSFSKMIKDLDEFTKPVGGEQEMEKLKFKLSDSEKFDLLFSAINPDFNEEGDWTISYMIADVYDEYFVAYGYEEAKLYRVFYDKSEDSVEIKDKEEVHVEYVTDSELSSLKTIRGLNGDTYENAEAIYSQVEELKEANKEFEAQKVEYEQNVSTLTQEKEDLTEKYSKAEQLISEQSNQIEELSAYKLEAETKEKTSIINKYSEKLTQEVLDEFKEKSVELTVEDLDKELAYALVKLEPSILNGSDSNSIDRLPKPEPKTGIEGILDKYK